MSFRQVNAFLAVASCQSLSVAASELRMTRVVLSRVIRELEAQLGEALFERRPRGIQLTAAGEVLLPFVKKLATAYSSAIRVVTTSGSDHVSLAASSVVLPTVLPKLMQRISGGVPEASLVLRELPCQQVVNEVRGNVVDIGLCMTVQDTVQGLQVTPLIRAPIGLLAREDTLVPHSIQSFEDLSGLRYVRLSSEMAVPVALQQSNAPLLSYFESPFVCNSISTAFIAVSHGSFVTLISAVAASSPLPADLRFIPLPQLLPSLYLSYVHRQDDAHAKRWADSVCASVRAVNWHPAAEML